MEYTRARAIADELVNKLSPFCEKIVIAGSVRRMKPEPRDIEIVAVPRFESRKDLFGNPLIRSSLLDPALLDLRIGRFELNGPRQKKLLLPEGICLDLFLVLEPAQFGVIKAIRTGPADYSRWLITPRQQGGALPSYLRVADGALWNGRDPLTTPEEQDFYRALELEWIAPELRCPPTRVPAHIEPASLKD